MKPLASGIGLLLLVASSAVWSATPGMLNAEIPATGITSLKLTAGSGQIKLGPSGDDAIHVQLDMRQSERSFLGLYHWMSGTTTHDLQAAEIHQDRQGQSLALSLVYPSGASHSDVKQQWTITLPARLKVVASAEAGQLVINGIQGGVNARLNYGDLTIHSPGGPLQAHVRTGRLHVISGDARPGVIKVASTFGLAIMSLNGKYYGPPERHGFMSNVHLFGNSLQEQAGGMDNMQFSVFAGMVDVRFGAQGDEKEYRNVFSGD